MKLKTKLNRYLKRNQRKIENAKLSLCWIVAFSLIVSTYTIIRLSKSNQEYVGRLDACQTNVETLNTNLEVILKQYDQPSVIYRLEKKGGEK